MSTAPTGWSSGQPAYTFTATASSGAGRPPHSTTTHTQIPQQRLDLQATVPFKDTLEKMLREVGEYEQDPATIAVLSELTSVFMVDLTTKAVLTSASRGDEVVKRGDVTQSVRSHTKMFKKAVSMVQSYDNYNETKRAAKLGMR